MSVAASCALMNIKLVDGPTKRQASAWLQARGIPAIFVTGRIQVTARNRDILLGFFEKPSPLLIYQIN